MADETKQIKEKLEELGISHQTVADELSKKLQRNISKAIITKTLNGNYEGSKQTKDEVLEICKELILSTDPKELERYILQHSNEAQELFNEGSLNKKFSPSVRKVWIKIYEALQKYNSTKNQNNQAA